MTVVLTGGVVGAPEHKTVVRFIVIGGFALNTFIFAVFWSRCIKTFAHYRPALNNRRLVYN